jgi:hypothetical protein
MSQETTVTCDGCGENIKTTTGYASEAYLELRNIWKGHTGGAVFAMTLGGVIDNNKQFHGLNCLRKFMEPHQVNTKKGV